VFITRLAAGHSLHAVQRPPAESAVGPPVTPTVHYQPVRSLRISAFQPSAWPKAQRSWADDSGLSPGPPPAGRIAGPQPAAGGTYGTLAYRPPACLPPQAEGRDGPDGCATVPVPTARRPGELGRAVANGRCCDEGALAGRVVDRVRPVRDTDPEPDPAWPGCGHGPLRPAVRDDRMPSVESMRFNDMGISKIDSMAALIQRCLLRSHRHLRLHCIDISFTKRVFELNIDCRLLKFNQEMSKVPSRSGLSIVQLGSIEKE
jgi:hypothetical protein